jgi:hypothetical protein
MPKGIHSLGSSNDARRRSGSLRRCDSHIRDKRLVDTANIHAHTVLVQ